MLNRDAILSALDWRREAVEVPEWGGTIYVREFSGADRDAFYLEVLRRKQHEGEGADVAGLTTWLLVRTLCDEQGNLLFAPEDEAALAAKAAAVLNRLFLKAMEINGLAADAADAAAKNLPSARGGATGSDSPAS